MQRKNGLFFTQKGVFYLSKLEHAARPFLGRRYHLSDDDELMEFLLLACNVDNRAVKQAYFKFFSNCWPETQEMLKKMRLGPAPEYNHLKVAV